MTKPAQHGASSPDLPPAFQVNGWKVWGTLALHCGVYALHESPLVYSGFRNHFFVCFQYQNIAYNKRACQVNFCDVEGLINLLFGLAAG